MSSSPVAEMNPAVDLYVPSRIKDETQTMPQTTNPFKK